MSAASQNSIDWTTITKYVVYGSVAITGAILLYNYFVDDEDSSLDIKVNPKKLSYAKNWYKTQADVIQKHLWATCLVVYCEDDSEAADVLKMLKTDDDYYQLILDYGLRSSTDPWTSWMFEDLDLVQTITEYLDADYKEEVNQVWASRNMQSRLT